MKHKKIEKLISNNIDGELQGKKKKLLEKHLRKCQSCSSYAENIQRIHEEAKSLEKPDASPVLWEEFASQIKTEICSTKQEKQHGKALFLKWKWAWASAALSFVIAAGLFLYLNQSKTPQEIYVFSFESSLAKIYQEIGNDQKLEELFNSVISASIGETLEDSEWSDRPDYFENLILWEDLTEEEMRFLESEIKKENKF
ncbi:MAG: hypothetical protein GTO16_09205 [Candidatus Aminicenantes bacterium]|nr:hypothetical protein [Candidatus Aminicenantes bacterium]